MAEGHKLVGDLLGHFPCKLLIATSNWLKMNHSATANEIIEVTQEELSRASLQKTPQEVLAVFVQPSYDLNPEVIKVLYAWHWTMYKTRESGNHYPLGRLVWH